MDEIDEPRPAYSIIDQAIWENRYGEYVAYGLSVCLFLVGAIVIVIGAYQGNGLVAIAGGLSGVFLIPAIRWANQIRRENIAIRLLEAPLSKAHSSDEAAIAIQSFFEQTFKRRL